jgi:hypothetical protein
MISAHLTTRIRHGKFLRFDSGPFDNRLVIFTSIDQLKILEDTKEMVMLFIFILGNTNDIQVITYFTWCLSKRCTSISFCIDCR